MPENSLPAGGSGSGDKTRARRGGPHESGRWLLRPLLPPGLRRRCRGQGNSLAGGPGGGGAITSSAWGEPGREAPTRPHTHGWTLWASARPGLPSGGACGHPRRVCTGACPPCRAGGQGLYRSHSSSRRHGPQWAEMGVGDGGEERPSGHFLPESPKNGINARCQHKRWGLCWETPPSRFSLKRLVAWATRQGMEAAGSR